MWSDGWAGELGQEPTPELFVAHLVAVFEAVRRVLRDDGTLWVNLAGSYWSEPGGQNGGSRPSNNGQGSSTLYADTARSGHGHKAKALHTISAKAVDANRENGRKKRSQHPVYKPLDWVDVPGLFARAMQANGWLWRSDVVWVKPSALPESVQGTRFERCRVKVAPDAKRGDPIINGRAVDGDAVHFDHRNVMAGWADCPGCPKCRDNQGLVLRRGSGRPTKATERVLLFAKRAGYFFDQEAVREPASPGSDFRPRPDGYQAPYGEEIRITANLGNGSRGDPSGRNLRDWWVIGPEPLRDSHYAAYPSALPDRCIRAGTSEWGCCPGCGAPWARVVAEGARVKDDGARMDAWDRGKLDPVGADTATGGYATGLRQAGFTPNHHIERTTNGWRPTCRCQPQQPPSPCRVLDPFGGSGTTALAANRLGRDCTLIELKSQYADLARKRVGREPLSLFATHGDTGGILPVEEADGAVAR